MNTHTQGPWEQEIAATRRFRSKGTNIVNRHGTVGKLVGFSIEDRRLIAAAPELLAAAKELMLAMKVASNFVIPNDVRDDFERAISKAEGLDASKVCAFCGEKFQPRTETRPGAFDPEIYCSGECTVHAQEAK